MALDTASYFPPLPSPHPIIWYWLLQERHVGDVNCVLERIFRTIRGCGCGTPPHPPFFLTHMGYWVRATETQ